MLTRDKPLIQPQDPNYHSRDNRDKFLTRYLSSILVSSRRGQHRLALAKTCKEPGSRQKGPYVAATCLAALSPGTQMHLSLAGSACGLLATKTWTETWKPENCLWVEFSSVLCLFFFSLSRHPCLSAQTSLCSEWDYSFRHIIKRGCYWCVSVLLCCFLYLLRCSSLLEKKKTSTSACQCLSVLVCAVFCSRVLNGKGFDLSCFIYSLF